MHQTLLIDSLGTSPSTFDEEINMTTTTSDSLASTVNGI